jgi:hypothetical protein
MKSHVLWLLLLLLVPRHGHAAQPPTGSLCHAQEASYFSCETNRHKTISLCGVLPASLQYRYGSAARMELQFPDAAAQGTEQLRYAHYSRFQTDRAEVTFSLADADYAVFDYTEDGKRSAGVHVATADGVAHEIRCVGPIHGRLNSLDRRLPCDDDSALNGGQCP